MRDRQPARRRHAQAQVAFSQRRSSRDHASHVVRGVSLGTRRGADGRCRSYPRRHARDLRRTPSRAQPVSSIPNRGRHARRRQRISQDVFHRRRARRAARNRRDLHRRYDRPRKRDQRRGGAQGLALHSIPAATILNQEIQVLRGRTRRPTRKAHRATRLARGRRHHIGQQPDRRHRTSPRPLRRRRRELL